MKKLTILLIAALMAIGATSCKDNEGDGLPGSLVADPAELNFTRGGGVESFVVKAFNTTGAWTITHADQWIKHEVDTENPNRIVVTVDATTVERNGVIKLSAPGANDTEVKVFQTVRYFTVDKEEIEFMAAGGDEVLTVTAEGLTSWTVTPSAAWLTYTINPENANQVVLTATASQTYREATVTISGEGAEDVVVNVIQEGQIFRKNSAKLMNFHGKVKSVSYHNYYPRDVNVTNLEFDEQGYLTSYVHTNISENTKKVTITYNTQGMPDKLTVNSPDLGYTYEVVFGYGTHGKYISTDEVIETISGWNYNEKYNISYYIWMPKFIENLESITLIDAGNPRDNLSINFQITGNTGVGMMKEGDGEPFAEFDNYVFGENGFPTAGNYGSGWFASACVFTVDAANGTMLSIDKNDGEIVFTFGNDRINTFREVESVYQPAKYEFNDNLDCKGYYFMDEYEGDINYEYDEAGNWITRTGVENTEFNKTRTITYWE